MKTRLLAMLAVFAMVFAGAVVAIDDQADAAAFDSNSVIDAYARSTNTSHAIHYNTDGGMLRISFSATDYATLNTPDVAVQVIKDSETPVIYDPVSKAQDIYVNIGALGTSTTVKVAVHGSDFASGTIDFILGAFSTTTINYVTAITENVTATNGTLNNDVCTPNTTARNLEVSFTQTTGVNSFIGWAVSAEAAAAKTVAISSGASLETVLMGATLETATYKVYAVWSNDSFTLKYDFNKPAATSGARFVNTTSATDIGSSEAEAAFMSTGVLKDSTKLVAGTDYVPADYDAEATGDQALYLAGYQFKGWFTAPVGGTEAKTSGTSIQAAFKTTNLKEGGSYTLYAHWDATSYTVTYDSTKLAVGFDIETSPTLNWNNQTIAYDSNAALMTIAQLSTAAGGTGLVAKSGYIFSHWELSSDSTKDYEAGALVNNLDATWGSATVTLYPVFDYKVTVTGIAASDVNFQPTGRTTVGAGYEFLIDGDSETEYTFDVVYDNLLYNVTTYTVSGGTAKAADMDQGTEETQVFTAYDNGKVSAKVETINAPITIELTVTANTYKVTAKVGEAAAESDGSIVVVDGTVTATWTNVVPNGKAGLITFASTAATSYIYAVTTTASDVEISKVSDKVFRIVPGSNYGGNPIPLALTATAADKNTPIAAFYIDKIANDTGTPAAPGQVVAYITGERSEVPAGTFAVSGTVYKTEGGVTTYSVLTGSGTQSAVEQPGVHSGSGAFVENKSVGSGYNEYRIVFTTSDSYNVYAAKVTFTPTDGSAISTAEAIVG